MVRKRISPVADLQLSGALQVVMGNSPREQRCSYPAYADDTKHSEATLLLSVDMGSSRR